MSVGDEDKPTKWLQREGQNMLPITIIQEPLDVRTPLDPLDIDSPTLACSRLSDRGNGVKRYEQ